MTGRGKLYAVLYNRVQENSEIASNTGSETSGLGSSQVQSTQTASTSRGRGFLFRRAQASTSSSTNLSEELNAKLKIDETENVPDQINEPEPRDVKEFGTKGKSIKVAANYIRIKCKSKTIMHEYYVTFDPDIHSNQIRKLLLHQTHERIGAVKTFDGTILFLPHKLPEPVTKIVVENDNKPITLTIKYQRERPMADCINFFNLLFKQIMRMLEYVQFGRKLFDPTAPKVIPQYKLSIWPGYVIAVDEYHDGLMVMLDVSHRVLCNTTVHDLMRRILANKKQNFRETFLKSVIGTIVLAAHSKRTYTIDDVEFDQNPLFTFETKTGPITYVEYYKRNYGVDIQDHGQPLLISYKERKIRENNRIEKIALKIALIPELCHLTGLTDEMRNDNKVMRDIASITRVTPNQRVDAMRKFIKKVKETPKAAAFLNGWGLELDDDLIKLDARQLGNEKLQIGNGKYIQDVAGNFTFGGGFFEAIDLRNWFLIYTKRDYQTKENFLKCVNQCAGGMGIMVTKPSEIVLADDRNESYGYALRQSLRHDTQIAVFICPTSRDDRYAVIKKICCGEIPVASQVINSRTLSNPSKNRSIVQKILMQMNCKLGGSLWSIDIPFPNVMICGIDTYHHEKSNSVSAFVASLNRKYTQWYSKATIQSKREELLHGLEISMRNALNAYKKTNGVNPDRIIVYRDGVSDGQFKVVEEFEFPQIKQACRIFDDGYDPNITYIVVQKRINTRIFKIESGNSFGNPEPGTIIDHTITRRFLFDFYLVSQQMTQGTVTPVHYVVIKNECNFPADILQRLSYKLTYQYFNWPGSIRVPAPCQYAHKLAYLVGESIKKETHEKLGDKLFYL